MNTHMSSEKYDALYNASLHHRKEFALKEKGELKIK